MRSEYSRKKERRADLKCGIGEMWREKEREDRSPDAQ
jgi:hypothetical protein